MGYVWTDDEDGDDGNNGGNTGQQDGPAQLPAPARKHLRNLEKQLEELKKERDALKRETRTATAADLAKAKGFSPAIAALIPSDVDGQEAVGKWLDDNAALFAKMQTDSGAGADGTGGGDAPPDGVPPELAQALGLMANATAQALTPSKIKDVEAQMKAADSSEALLAIMRANGAKV